jgi:hypothetical protein
MLVLLFAACKRELLPEHKHQSAQNFHPHQTQTPLIFFCPKKEIKMALIANFDHAFYLEQMVELTAYEIVF